MTPMLVAIDAPATPPPRPDEDPRDRPAEQPEVPPVPPTEPPPMPVIDPPPEPQSEPPYIVTLARWTAAARRHPVVRRRACLIIR
jgi:hypothetical protein